MSCKTADYKLYLFYELSVATWLGLVLISCEKKVPPVGWVRWLVLVFLVRKKYRQLVGLDGWCWFGVRKVVLVGC
jgi:hypothetical protein